MSEHIAYRRIEGVYDHPKADRLAIVRVGKFTVVHPLEKANELHEGQLVIHVPPDICIDPKVAEELGVSNYLKRCKYKNEGEKVACWVRSARIRQVPSQGFIIEGDTIPDEELDIEHGACRYEPPALSMAESHIMEFEDHLEFPKYTKITRIQYNPEVWPEGIPVRITEKIHGMNARFGVVRDGDDWRFMVGSHNCILREYAHTNHRGEHKMGAEPRKTPFWDLLDDRVMNLLNDLCDSQRPVVIYAERFGPGVQDLDYGVKEPEIRVFDIMVDGKYLDWDLVEAHCARFGLITVPLLRKASFTWCMIDAFTDGSSIVTNRGAIKSAFKGREGIVITPLEETYCPELGGRLIGKSISVDYESRRGGTEYN